MEVSVKVALQKLGERSRRGKDLVQLQVRLCVCARLCACAFLVVSMCARYGLLACIL